MERHDPVFMTSSFTALVGLYLFWYTASMNPILSVRFFVTEAGSEPVRNWLQGLSAKDRKAIGEDIKTVQFGWPLGMPLVDHLESNIWEIRIKRDVAE